MQGKRFKVMLARGSALSSLMLATVAFAQPKTFNIPSEEAAKSIPEFGRQAGLQITAPMAGLRGVQTPAISGSLEPEAALAKLLAGTNLIVARNDGRTVTLQKRPAEMGANERFPVAADINNEAASANEIVVTASKRPEKLKDVPSSVTALLGQSLLQQGATKLEDYATRVPGFTVQNVSVAGGLNQLTLRGITTGFAGNPTVGFYVDDAPFGASGGIGSSVLSPDLDPADIERVEVLRGPQGTLYGAGSMGGLVKFVTRAPSTTEFSGRAQAGLISTDGGGTGYALRGSVNVPLADNVAIRVNGYTREDPGYIDDPTHGGKDVNKNNYAGGKASLLWKVGELTTVRLSATIQHQDNDGSGTIDVNSFTFAPLAGDLQHSRSPGTDSLDTTLKLYDLRVTHDFGWAELMSVSSWGKNKFSSNFDYTPLAIGLLPALFGPGVTGGGLVNTVNNLTKFTQEVRLTSPSTNRFFWQIGVLYTTEHAFAAQSITPVNATSGAVIPLPTIYDTTVDSTFREIAAFGTVGYKITDRFDFSVGGRFSRNKQKAIQVDAGLLGAAGGVSKSRDSVFTFLVTPRYRVNDNLMVYGRVASGYRPGGPNIGGPVSTFGPDKLINYEVGLKGDMFDKAMSLDISAFLIDWKDIQVGQIDASGLGYFGNAARAKSKGIEASTLLRPIRGLQIAGNVTYLDAYLAKTLTAPLTLVGQKGDQLPSAARWSGSLNVDYDFALSDALSAFVGGSWRYTGKRRGDFAGIFSFGRPRATLDSYDAFDLRAGLTYERWTLSGYVRNIADKRGYSAAFAQGAVTSVSLIQPRTFGLTVSTEF